MCSHWSIQLFSPSLGNFLTEIFSLQWFNYLRFIFLILFGTFFSFLENIDLSICINMYRFSFQLLINFLIWSIWSACWLSSLNIQSLCEEILKPIFMTKNIRFLLNAIFVPNNSPSPLILSVMVDVTTIDHIFKNMLHWRLCKNKIFIKKRHALIL